MINIETFKESVNAALANKALDSIVAITEDILPVGGAAQLSMHQMTDRVIGKIAIVNRIRNGKVQLNKKVDVMGKGYKLLPNGLVVLMSPVEIRNRARAAKIAAKKRNLEMFQILRKRANSEIKRNMYFGG